MEASLLLRAAIPPRSARKQRRRCASAGRSQVGPDDALGARLDDEIDEQAMVEAAVEELHATMGVHAGGVFAAARRRAARAGRPAPGASSDADWTGYSLPVERGLVGRCLRERRVVLVGDVRREPDYAATAGHRARCARSSTCPLLVRRLPLGR